MTVTYTAHVATCTGLGCFLKLLKRWRGSIYKLVWKDLFIFLTLYFTISVIYRFLLGEESRIIFKLVIQYFRDHCELIPVSFVLGFYVSVVMTRWWNQYTTIPWPDTIAVFVSATVHGLDERGRVMRRTIMRYVCLCITMMFTMICPRVKKRFPTLDHLVEAGLLQISERDIIVDLNNKFPKYSKHWMPIVWASSIITRARKEGRIRDDFAVKTLLDELNKLRGSCGLLLSYDTISVPLVYTQVVTLAVYSYFLTTLVAHQSIDNETDEIDCYFPIFTTLQFFFYVGWLKVAETLINPFGDDDDDFEVNWMVDRNLQMSYLIVDEMHQSHPELVRDQYWDEVFPDELPHTLASEPFRDRQPLPSTANIAVMHNAAENAAPTSVKVNDDMQSLNDMRDVILFTARGSSAANLKQMGTSVPDSISRASSKASLLKRLMQRQDSRASKFEKESPVELTPANATSQHLINEILGSTNSLPPQPKTQPNSIRITDQVIDEVDEQLTITSQKNESRPSVLNVFGPPPPSLPISVPSSKNRVSPEEISRSAPTESQKTTNDILDNISIGSVTDDSDDEFTKLKNKRQKERRSRLILSLTKSQESNMGDPYNDTETLLDKRSPPSTATTISPRDRTQSARSSIPDDNIFIFDRTTSMESSSTTAKKTQ